MAGAVKWRIVTIFVVTLAINLNRAKASQEVMKKMTKTFLNVLEECKKELSITTDMIESLALFWTENSVHADRDLGCLIMCMAQKQNLMHLDKNRMHHENAYKFSIDHGADETTAKQIVTMIHECEEIHVEKEDHCTRVLEVARCFRDHTHRLKWAPTVEMLIGEFMIDMTEGSKS